MRARDRSWTPEYFLTSTRRVEWVWMSGSSVLESYRNWREFNGFFFYRPTRLSEYKATFTVTLQKQHNFTNNSTWCISTHLELVADADEAEFSRLLLDVFAVVGVFKESADKSVLGLADQTLQRHVQGVVVLLHKLGLTEGDIFQIRLKKKMFSGLQRCIAALLCCFSFTSVHGFNFKILLFFSDLHFLVGYSFLICCLCSLRRWGITF